MFYLKRLFLFGSLLATLLCSAVRAKEPKPPKPDPTVEQLRAEVDSLKNQLAQLNTLLAFEAKICNVAIGAAREFVQLQSNPSANQRTQPPRAPTPEPSARNR